jgi:site-specific DNA-cytosine methylase
MWKRIHKQTSLHVVCHDVKTKISPLVTNIDHTWLLAFLTKQHHLARGPNLARIRPIDLVISRWSCQGLSQANTDKGFSDPRLGLFWELICVVQHL